MRRRTRIILLMLALFAIGSFLLRSRMGNISVKTGSYLLLDLDGEYVEAPPDDLVGRLIGGHTKTLLGLLTTLRVAKVDQRISGVILRISSLEIGWAKAQDIRDALMDFRQSNKPLLALLEQEGNGSNREYYIATAADRVYLAPTVTAPLTGLAAQFIFLGGLWDKLDIDMAVEKIREYKTMGDMLANKEMSAPHREMANSLLDSIDGQFVGAVADSRQLEVGKVRELINQSPVSPSELEAAGLSDGTKFLQTLHDEQGGDQTPLVRGEDYERVDPASLGLGRGPKIAVVYAVGPIQSGVSGTDIQGRMVGADTVSRALHDAADDDDVRAIVLRIDSPGGSALASDLIWRATRYARAKKPLVVSMSDVAASGGYFIAAGANKIVAQPGTMTGSIGVVMARPVVKKLLADYGVHTETITRGRFAYLDDLTVPLDAEGRGKLVAGIEHVYAQFIDRVAAGRSLSVAEVDAIGRGRVWTGEQAKERRLVDELGGFQHAIDIAKQLANIDTVEEVELVFYPKAKPFGERVAEMLTTRAVQLPPSLAKFAAMVSSPFADGTVLTMMRESIDIR